MRADKARKHDFPNHQQVLERQRERLALKEDGIPPNKDFSLDDLSDAVREPAADEEQEAP